MSGPILDIRGMDAFFGANIFKNTFCLLPPPNQMSFLTIINKNMFFENRSTRFGCDNHTQQSSRTGPEYVNIPRTAK